MLGLYSLLLQIVTKHDVTLTYIVGLYSLLFQIVTKQLHFPHKEDILTIKGRMIFSAVGKCSIVVWEGSCWHKKVTVRLLVATACTANKDETLNISNKFYFIRSHLSLNKLHFLVQ